LNPESTCLLVFVDWCVSPSRITISMTSTLSPGCIPANPDIAGIGIRASTYAQNFLGVFLAACYLIDGKISRDEADYIESASNTILMTGCAIIISAFIQARTIGLSVYHAMIVLNLSWMNNTYFSISGIFTVAMNQQGRCHHETKRKGFRVVQYLGFIHLSLMASFGIWVWLEIDKIGDSPECTPYLFMVIFGHNVSAINKSLW
jgi:hypothetical protein